MKKSKINRKGYKLNILNLFVLSLVTIFLFSITVSATKYEEKSLILHFEDIPVNNNNTSSLKTLKQKTEVDVDVVINPKDKPKKNKKTKKIKNVLTTISEKELFFFAQCVEIEAEGEGVNGKLAVANVLINRKNSENFPNTYEQIVSQSNNGYYQFCSYSGDTWGTKDISEETYEAIHMALNGKNNVGNATYFCNLKYCEGGWFTTAENSGKIKRVVEIGQHTFYSTN